MNTAFRGTVASVDTCARIIGPVAPDPIRGVLENQSNAVPDSSLHRLASLRNEPVQAGGARGNAMRKKHV